MPIDALALGGHGAIVERKAGRFLRQESPRANQHDRVARVRAANEAHCVPGGLENGACLGRRHGKVSRRCKPLASGAGRGSRTPDLRITNALLYQLSYTGKKPNIIAD